MKVQLILSLLISRIGFTYDCSFNIGRKPRDGEFHSLRITQCGGAPNKYCSASKFLFYHFELKGIGINSFEFTSWYDLKHEDTVYKKEGFEDRFYRFKNSKDLIVIHGQKLNQYSFLINGVTIDFDNYHIREFFGQYFNPRQTCYLGHN